GDGSSNPVACKGCPTAEGIPPFMALGIPAATAHDGWGHWITMRVDPALTILPSNPANCAASNSCSSFVPPAALCLAVDVSNGVCTSVQAGAAKGLCRTNIDASNRINVAVPGAGSQQAAVIFVSHGASGYGAYVANAENPDSNGCRLQTNCQAVACT